MRKNGSFLILFNDLRDKVFLVLRSDYPIWVLTGGGIEVGENPEKAALREAYEESGFKIKLIRKLGQYNQVDNKNLVVKTDYVFEGRVVSGNFVPEFEGCEGKWFSIKNLPFDMTSFTKRMIGDAANSDKVFVKSYRYKFNLTDFKFLLLHPYMAFRYIANM